MTTGIASLGEAGAAPPAARVIQLPAVSAAGVSDSAALARQQLPNAVPAPALIAAYAANVPNVPKPVSRAVSTNASSQLAAQFIAQDPELTPEELEIFIPRSVQTPLTAEEKAGVESFISPARAARGELAPVASESTQVAANAESTITEKTQAANQAGTILRSGMSQLAAGLPGLLSQFTRSLTLVQARGVGAYQLAQARNAVARKPAESI